MRDNLFVELRCLTTSCSDIALALSMRVVWRGVGIFDFLRGSLKNLEIVGEKVLGTSLDLVSINGCCISLLNGPTPL